MDTIIDPEELKKARSESLGELEQVVKTLGKKAALPAKKQVMAELEATLERVKADWASRGLVAA